MKRALIITGPGFEDSEVIYPLYRLKEAGLKVDIVTSNDAEVKGKHGHPIKPTIKIGQLKTSAYDIVVVPGGHEAPDRVRQVKKLTQFVRQMYLADKIVSSVCHGPWVLVSADILRGKKATCYPGMKDDLKNAGATYINKPVVKDGNLITSDHPKNLHLWMESTINKLTESKKA